MANVTVTSEQVKNLKLGDSIVKGITIPNTIVESVSNTDKSITITGSTPTPVVSVNIKSGGGLAISTTSGSEGLYVDKDALGLSAAYVPKGSMAVSEANAKLSAGSPGWVYNLTDEGDIDVDGSGSGSTTVHVKEGDNVVIIEEGSPAVKKWDKLSATIDVSVSDVQKTDPITVSSANGVFTIGLGTGRGLDVPATSGSDADKGKLIVKGGDGIDVSTSGGVKANIDTAAGLKFDSSSPKKIQVNKGDGLAFDGGAVKVDVNGDKGLEIDSTSKKVQVKVRGGLDFVSSGNDKGKLEVQVDDTTVKLDGNSKVAAKLGAGLTTSSGIAVDVDGATIKLESSKVAAKLDPQGGLEPNSTTGIKVAVGNGVALLSGTSQNGVYVNANTGAGITNQSGSSSNQVGVKAGDNVGFDGNGNVVVDIDKSSSVTIDDDTTIATIIGLLGGPSPIPAHQS